MRDIEVERVECFGTQCGGQFSLPQEQGESVCSLEVDCDQVSPVGSCEVEQVHGTEGSMQCLGGGRDPGTP